VAPGPAATRWREALEGLAIPPEILAGVHESPWVLSERAFARRADEAAARPGGPTRDRAEETLAEPGTILDIGSGAGAASLPLAGRATKLTAVDEKPGMLRACAERAARAGLPVELVEGRWPDVAGRTGPADLVLAVHVIYNVPDLPGFAAALTGHARRRVVCEITECHPLTTLGPLWRRFHGLERPDGPVAADAVAVLREAGLEVDVERWGRPAEDNLPFAEFADVTRRRLCLPRERTPEVAAALREQGPEPPRELVTIWWAGTAG
jgi:SAM-dependent methyltransferase